MARYRWIGHGPFEDHLNNRVIESGDVVEISDEIADAWTEFRPVEDDADAEGDTTPDADADTPDYSEMSYSELRDLAVEADTDEINGRSKKDEIIAYFSDN